jgi:hypothetical protein
MEIEMASSVRTFARALAVGAVSFGIAAGVAATPAEAATPPHATFGVQDEGTGYSWIPVDAVFPMSQAAAQDAINHGYHVEMRLWGDDPSSDDLQFTYPNANSSAQPDGLHATRSARVANSVLNEDDSFTDRTDELYVGVRVVAANGFVSLKVESNRVTGRF